MDNYIVRVLRRQRLGQLDGVVEMVETGSRRAFHSADELWAILNSEALTDTELLNQDSDDLEQE